MKECAHQSCDTLHAESFGVGKFCSRSCMAKFQYIQEGEKSGLSINQQKKEIEPKICTHPACNIIHIKPGKFCSYTCANSRGPMSEERKEFNSQYSKENPKGVALDPAKYGHQSKGKRRTEYMFTVCKWCDEEFEHRKSEPRTYCGEKCWKEGSGGIREGSGKTKSGNYQGFWCDSQWELAYIIYCLNNRLEIERNTDYWEYLHPGVHKIRRYYPDFRVNGKLVEIKGMITPADKVKWSAVDEPLEILTKVELKPIFERVVQLTGIKIENLSQLYDT